MLPSSPSKAASATTAVDAKKVALCTVWPMSEASTIRLSRANMVSIQVRRMPRRRAVMLRGERRPKPAVPAARG